MSRIGKADILSLNPHQKAILFYKELKPSPFVRQVMPTRCRAWNWQRKDSNNAKLDSIVRKPRQTFNRSYLREAYILGTYYENIKWNLDSHFITLLDAINSLLFHYPTLFFHWFTMFLPLANCHFGEVRDLVSFVY